MRDTGVVVSTGGGMARIRVNCLSGCEDCAAHHLCIGSTRKKGLLQVRNPLQAGPGDHVGIDIPESRYNRALIFIFGSLLGSALAGMALGWIAARFTGLTDAVTIPAGFFVGLAIVTGGLFRIFRTSRTSHLYPSIVEIIPKGVTHG
jgi:positive regulator of sigma E activity